MFSVHCLSFSFLCFPFLVFLKSYLNYFIFSYLYYIWAYSFAYFLRKCYMWYKLYIQYVCINVLPLQVEYKNVTTLEVPLAFTFYVIVVICIISTYIENPIRLLLIAAFNHQTYFLKTESGYSYISTDVYFLFLVLHWWHSKLACSAIFI